MRTKRCRGKVVHRPYRPLASKQDQPPHLNVQRLSITQIGESSYITIHPSKARIKATDLINMIKEDHIITNTGEKVPSQDLVIATTQLLTATAPEGLSTHEGSNVPMDVWKRQANAFIRYRRENGKKLQALIPEYSEADISKFLGAVWKITPENVKQKYRQEWSASVAEQKEKNPNFRYNPSNKSPEVCSQHPEAVEACCSSSSVRSGEDEQASDGQIQQSSAITLSDLHNCPDLPDGTLDEFFSSLFLSYQNAPGNEMSSSLGLTDAFSDEFNAYKFLDDWQSMLNLCTTPHSQPHVPVNLFQFPDPVVYNPLTTLNPADTPVDPLAFWDEASNLDVTNIQQNDDVHQQIFPPFSYENK